jgi:hypothetical protein
MLEKNVRFDVNNAHIKNGSETFNPVYDSSFVGLSKLSKDAGVCVLIASPHLDPPNPRKQFGFVLHLCLDFA